VPQSERPTKRKGLRNAVAKRLALLADRLEKAARAGNLKRIAEQAKELRSFAESMERTSDDAFARLQQAEQLASIDPLTGLANRREFDRQLASRIAADREFCVLLFDLNQFKTVNDRHGHLCGDEILRQLSARLRRQVRTDDFLIRWGGDEFVAILDCGLKNAVTRARTIAQSLSGPYKVTVQDQKLTVKVSVSAGVAERKPRETPEQLFHRVDRALYRDKKANRS
jgi:diguanylate cyclase (GGDEF)-like protein